MTKDDIIRMAREAAQDARLPFSKPEHPSSMSAFCESFAALVAAAEREACAVIAFNAKTYIKAAKSIRARGQG